MRRCSKQRIGVATRLTFVVTAAAWAATIALLFFVFATCSTPARADSLFDAPFTTVDVGDGPASIAVADLNADSRLDLAVVNRGDDSVSILLGNGDGSFEQGPTLATRYDPRGVAIGDLNADGHPDLAVANGAFFSVSVFLGSGDGTFGPGATFECGADPSAVAIADWNSDGKPDLAVANSFYSTVSILLGNGDGTFRRKTDFATGQEPCSIAVGDLNGDSRLDLVTTNRPSHSVSILLGNGDGTFAPKADFEAGDEPTSAAVADLNGDSRLDLVVANTIELFGTASLLLGNGDGSFGAPSECYSGYTPMAVAIADLNGDAKPDLAFPTQFFLGSYVTVVLGNGDGTFGEPENFETGSGAQAMAIADFNGDSTPDAAVAASYSRMVCVHLGQGDGRFGTARSVRTGSAPKFVAIADLNHDAKLDLAVANARNYTVSIHLGNGDGTFAAGTHFQTGFWPYSVAVADLNGDAKLDLAVANDGARTEPGISVLLGNGDGTFRPRTDFGRSGSRGVAIADLNGDAIPDLAVANVNDFASTYLGRGDGTFSRYGDYPTGYSPQSIVVADLNADSRLDLVTANALSNSVSILLGNGDGSFRSRLDCETGAEPWCVACADLNGDSMLDLATANGQANTVSILFGDGAGQFGARTDLPALDPQFVTIADLDGDSNPDLAVTNEQTSTVSILLGSGDGTFRPRLEFGTGAGPSCVAVADLNLDARPDLAVANYDANTVALLLGRSVVPVAVEDFAARVLDDRVSLTWRISGASLSSIRGVAVQRAVSSAGPYVERTPQPLLPAPEMHFEDPIGGASGALWYRLTLVSVDGAPSIVGPLPAQSGGGATARLALSVAHNPARGQVRLAITMARPGEAIVRIFDARGRLVRELLRGVLRDDAPATILWDGRDGAGAPVASGVYTVHLTAPGARRVQKLAFVR